MQNQPRQREKKKNKHDLLTLAKEYLFSFCKFLYK